MIASPLDLFHHELRTMLYVELTLLDEVLPELATKVHDADAKAALEQHRGETRRHADTLSRIFGLLGAAARPVESPALEGLRDEHDEALKRFDDEDGTTEDAIHLGAVVKGEHHEIAAYESLIALASWLGERRVVAMLRENLADEEAALERARRGLVRLLG